jgi:hypothetical protein
MDIAAMRSEINNRITDKLSWTVKGHIAATTHTIHWRLPRRKDISLIRATP